MARDGRQDYEYTRLADLKPGSFNVIGVVKFKKPPQKSQGTDFVQVLSITDESLGSDGKIVITLFYSVEAFFPRAEVGDIIRFHRLRVETVFDELKGRPGPGFSWLLIKDVNNITASSEKHTYGEVSKKRVRELQGWARKQTWIGEALTCTPLCDMVPTKYSNLVCQVIGTAVPETDVCFVTRVWDGTKCNFSLAGFSGEMEKVDPSLVIQAAELAVDIWIYDDHLKSCQAIEPGQFIKLSNLHAAVFKDPDADKDLADINNPVIELVIHKGTSYGRGVTILSEDSPQVAVVKQRIENYLPAKSAADGAQSDGACPQTDEPNKRTQNQSRKRQVQNQAGKRQDMVSAGEGVPEAQEQSNRSQTATDSNSPTDQDSTQPGCSHWNTGMQGQESPVIITSSVDDAGVSPPKRICKGMGNKEVGSSSSVNKDRDADQDANSDCATTKRAGHQEDATHGGNGQSNSHQSADLLKEPCGVSSSSESGYRDQTSVQSSIETCMLQTASVVTGHQHISRTPIGDVLHHAVPSKFRVLAHVVDFHPKTTDPLQFVHLQCPKCFRLTKPTGIPEIAGKVVNTQSTQKSLASSLTSKLAGLLGGRLAGWNPDKLEAIKQSNMCSRCNQEGEMVPLELTYMMRLVLQDSRGDLLVANLWRDEAVAFFRGVSPELVLQRQGVLEDIMQTMRSLCLQQASQTQITVPPKLDCCLLSYNTQAGVNYHIFDTVLV